jgi:hypothetical protein
MPKVCKEETVGMDGIVELPKRNRSFLLGTLLPFFYNLDGEVK